MKKLLAMLLALSLMMTGVVVSAEPEEAALPAVGEVVHGFEVKEIREFPLIDAQAVLFEHQKTGAEMIYIANDDTNRVFDLTFFTDAVNKTGLPHVFEHSTLSGSEKYPSKALFFNLSYQTYNTFMNAFTMDRMTSYPVASLSEAQLLKYADFYTDSCLHPMIMQDESIYREEAWRYRMADEDAPLTIEGTVYSEMLGSFDKDAAAYKNSLAVTFPGSMIANEEGGDPAYIPDMTWDMLKDYHDTYYHPSNCVGYLYGQFDDYAAFLALLDEAFSPYEKREFTHVDPDYQPLTESVEATVPYPAESIADPEDQVIYYAVLCPNLSGEAALKADIFTQLLTDPSSPLQLKLKEALPYGDFSCYIEKAGPEPAALFVLNHAKTGDADTFRAVIADAMAEIAEKGFDPEMVDAQMSSLELEIRLIREKASVGVDSIIPAMAYNYALEGNPWGYMDYIDALSLIDEWNQQGVFAQAASELFVDPAITATTVTCPMPGLKEQNDAALAERLAEVKAGMTDEEKAAIIEASNAFEADDDAGEYIAQLQAVTVASLPEEVKEYDVFDETDELGVRHIDALAGVDGIGQANLFLDAAGLPQENLQWAKLYTDLMGELDTSAHTRAELSVLSGRYLYSGDIRLSLVGKDDDFHPYLRMTWIGNDDDLAAGYDLVREMVFDSKLEDVDRVVETVVNLENAIKNDVNSAPYNACLYRAMGKTSGLYRYFSYLNYTEYYAFLQQVEALAEADPKAVVEKLQAVRDYFNNSENAVTLFAGNEESIELNRGLADAFLASLDRHSVEPVTYDLPEVADAEALVIDGAIQFNGLVADYASLGLEGFEGGLDALTALVSDTCLYPLLRDQYGAYGVLHGAMVDDGVYVISYRDPNVAETFDVYAQLHDLVSGLDIDQETLDGYILSAYAGYAMPQGELSGATDTALSVLNDDGTPDAIESMRDLKAMTPERVKAYAGLYAKLVEKGILFTAGSASAIEANADLYDVVLNPFDAQDPTQVGFADLTEDHPQYEAVRFAFENGLMLPLSDDAFGVDEPATDGDTLTALYVLVGGDQNTEDALAFFAQYGLASADLDPDEVITGTDATGVMSSLATLMGLEWSAEDASEDVITRGDLAEILSQFVSDMNG